MSGAQPPISVRPERADDQADVRRLVGAAFGGEQVPRLLDALRAGDGWLDLGFVAEVEADSRAAAPEIVGYVAFTRSLLDAPARLVDVLVLSPLAVLPTAQRRGVGRTLVLRSLELLATRPEPLVFLEGSPDYYGRLGFRPAVELGFRRPSLRIPEAAFQVWPLPAFDTAPVGRLSGTLVYHSAFWDHDCVGLRD